MTEKKVLDIDDLPEEVIQYMLSFLDLDSSQEAARACRKFYELICQIQKDKFIAVIDCEIVSLNRRTSDVSTIPSFQISRDESLFRSMISSQRIFKEMKVDWNNCKYLAIEGLLKVVEKFGRRLKKLTVVNFVDQQYSNPQAVISILACLPQIEDLEISGSHLTKMKAPLEASQSSLRINRLKKLSLVNCTLEVGAIFNSISNDVLEEFNFHDYFYRSNEQFFQDFLDRQSKIKRLKVLGCGHVKLDHLELEQLSISPSRSVFPKVSNPFKLRIFKFNGKVGDTDLAEFCQLRNLNEVEINITEVTEAGIGVLKRLPELASLKLSFFGTDSASALGVLEYLQLPNLKNLSLEINPLITKQDVMKLSQNFPQLKQLEIYDSIASTLQEVFRCFPNIEKVSFHRMKNGRLGCETGYKSLKEIELTHVGSCLAATWKSELDFFKKCPSLEKIKILEVCNFQIEDLRALLESLPNLSHIELVFKSIYIDFDGKAAKKSVPCDLDFCITLLKYFEMCSKLEHLNLKQLAMPPGIKTLQTTIRQTFPSIKILINNKFKQILLQKR